MAVLSGMVFYGFTPIKTAVKRGGPLENPTQNITKKDLVKLVDSLLDLDAVDAREIELISYYNTLISTNEDELNEKEVKLSELNFYENMDESVIFSPAPVTELPDSMILQIENEGLSYYTAPREGVITSSFGYRDKRMHKGIDIDLNKGDAVVAAFDGKVRIAKRKGGYGNVVVIMHPNGLETVYAHLHKFKVKAGDVVLSGQTIGLGGNTGHSTGSHLHFEVRYKGQALNPASIISFTDHKLLDDAIVLKKSRKDICAFPGNATVHTVEKGESWYVLIKKYGLTTKQFCALNGTQKRFTLRAGQKVRIN